MEQLEIFQDNAEYDAFVEKFKQKKTTDDCYTPPLVYDAIRDWACAEYEIDPQTIVRPFYPGGDYENFKYPEGCTVLDNPPFSILTKICKFYLDRKIKFFLFAPSLTAFCSEDTVLRMNHIICDADITYENGAIVRTAFVTSYGADVVAQTEPRLGKAIADAMKIINAERKKELPKYSYPDYVLTAAMLQRYSKYGVEMKVHRGECLGISALDEQRKKGKRIFGGGLLISERAAAERAAAERAAAERAAAARAAAERAAAARWSLSLREREIVRALSQEKGAEVIKDYDRPQKNTMLKPENDGQMSLFEEETT